MFDRFGRAAATCLDWIDWLTVNVAKLLLVAMGLLTFVSVIGRAVFHAPVPDDLLLSEIFMVAVVFLPLGWVQAQGVHMEVTVLTDLFPRKLQSRLFVFGLLCGLVAITGVAYVSLLDAIGAYVLEEVGYNSEFDILLWPVKALIPAGLFLWSLRMLVQLVWPGLRPGLDSHSRQLESLAE